MNKQLNIMEASELKNDVIDHLRQLIKDISHMDIESVEQIALSLGVIEKPITHIKISHEIYKEDIGHFLPDGTPDYILLEALQNVKGILQDRASYDLEETLLENKEEIYKVLVEDIIDTLKEGFNYSFVDSVAFNEDKDDFMLIASAITSNEEGIMLLVKNQRDSTYELFKIVKDFNKEDLESKLFDSTIKDEELELLVTFELEKE